MDAPEPGTMSGGHILVQRLDGSRAAHLSVRLVHIVRAGSRIITDPDAEVLDFQGSLLVDDIERDNLAGRLLDLAQLHQEVPEAGFGHHGVGCKDAHAVQFRRWVRIGGQMAADDLVFLEAT